MQRVLRKSSPASNNQIPQASLPVRAGALFSCRLSSFWKSAGLQNHRPLVRIRPPSLRECYYKTETPVPGSDTGILGEHGWITQAALLKTAHWAVFALSSATAPQLFESTRLASGKVITKQKLQYPVRILEFLVGAGGFEPPKLKSSRFTVCPHWPLGNTPRFCSRPLPDDLFILSDCGRFVNYFFRIFAAFLRKLSAGSVLGQMFPALVIPQGGNGFAGHGV